MPRGIPNPKPVVEEEAVTVEESTSEADPMYWTMQSPAWYPTVNCRETFYDGAVDTVEGIALVPRDRADWVNRLIMNGYSLKFKDDIDAFSRIYYS